MPARAHHSEAWARERFAAAERMREALNGRPPGERTRHDYQRVINAYRSVYFGAPTSTKADPSVVAVAETLVEMGRRFEDDKILNEAIAQYKFLRKEYPGSKYRCDALFTIGEIYKDDLNDAGTGARRFSGVSAPLSAQPSGRGCAAGDRGTGSRGRCEKRRPRREAEDGGKEAGEQEPRAPKDSPAKGRLDAQADAKVEAASPGALPSRTPRELARVTGIRHWSTPDYTRVAIDLESEIKFGSQRIANPDRIFFDLRGTKLASTLVGKSFDVDDGFLKKIRVAQFQPGRTRVVLEVDDLSDYEAFLLPNPYRLIIDIHGRNCPARTARCARPKLKDADAATADVEAPPKTGSKPDLAKSVPKSELKADLKALAGKPVSKTEQIHDEEVAAKDDTESLTPSRRRIREARGPERQNCYVAREEGRSGSDEDDDTPPAKVAKIEAPTWHSRTSLTIPSRKAESAPEADAAAPDGMAAGNSPSAGQDASQVVVASRLQPENCGPRRPRSQAHGEWRPLADPRAGAEDRQDRDRSRPRRARYRNHRSQRLGRKRSGARSRPSPGQTSGDAAGCRSRLHAQGRYIHPARDPHRDCQPAARRSVYFDSRQFEPRFRTPAASKRTT